MSEPLKLLSGFDTPAAILQTAQRSMMDAIDRQIDGQIFAAITGGSFSSPCMNYTAPAESAGELTLGKLEETRAAVHLGAPVHFCEWLTETIDHGPRRRHRRRRIHKKWLRRYGRRLETRPACYKIMGEYWMHPDSARELSKYFAAKDRVARGGAELPADLVIS